MDIFILSIIILILMFSKKAKEYVYNHKEIFTSLLFIYMSIWFTRFFIRIENFKKILEQGKNNPIMYIQFAIFIGIPLYFIYMTIKSLILVYKKYKKESK